MKARRTIEGQIARLRRLAFSDNIPRGLAERCYEAWHALRWVVEDVNWTPAGEAEREAERKAVKTDREEIP